MTAHTHIRNVVAALTPIDDLEATHQRDVLAWIDSGAPLFRVAKPDKPPKHLVSYFVVFDEAHSSLLLIDHIKAGLWLPTGGHVEPDEDPRQTVVREAEEELGLAADFSTPFGDTPLFITTTVTRGQNEHTDVSLWYVIRGNRHESLTFDTREMRGYQWHTLPAVLAMDITRLDPHMHRFVCKLQGQLSKV